MKKNFVKMLCIVTAGMLFSCGYSGSPNYSDFTPDDIIGTWELVKRTWVFPANHKYEQIYPGVKEYASELTFYHDGEYVNKYDNERTDSGKWKKEGRMLRMTSDNGVRWGLVNVADVDKQNLDLRYITGGDVDPDVYNSPSVWSKDWENFNVELTKDYYKRIK